MACDCCIRCGMSESKTGINMVRGVEYMVGGYQEHPPLCEHCSEISRLERLIEDLEDRMDNEKQNAS